MSAARKVWSAGWRVAVCVVLLLWVFHSIFMREGKQSVGPGWEQMPRADQWHIAWSKGPKDLWHTLELVQLWALVTSVALVGVTIWLGVVRWRLVLESQGLHLPFRRACHISLVAQFFNSFLLGSTGGDVFKAYYAARETNHQKTEAVTTVFVDRLVGLWAMLFFACVMMVPNWQLLLHGGGPQRLALRVAALCIAGMLVALTVVLSLAFWGGLSKRFPRARAYLRRLPKGEVLERSLDSCRKFGQERGLLAKTFALSLLLNFIWVLQIYILGLGLGQGISFTSLLLIVPTILCISSVPITPNGLGLRENLYVDLLAVVAVASTPALSVSLLASAEGLFWSVLGGLVYLALRDKEHLADVSAESAAG